MEAEVELEAAVANGPRSAHYDPSFVAGIHRALYSRLPAADRTTDEGAAIVPGAWRTVDVAAGHHVAPRAGDIESLLEFWRDRYTALPGIEQAIVGAMCSHHRLLWLQYILCFRRLSFKVRIADGAAHKKVTLTGVVVQTSGTTSPIRFLLRDDGAPMTVPVSYHGSVPDAFKTTRHIIVTGQLRGGVFVAEPDTLLTKCPSKYSSGGSGA